MKCEVFKKKKPASVIVTRKNSKFEWERGKINMVCFVEFYWEVASYVFSACRTDDTPYMSHVQPL